MNIDNMKHIESIVSFKPIEDDSSSASTMEFHKAASSTEIFREITMEEPLFSDSEALYTVCRAKPIDSSESDEKMERRVISPFNHSTSWEELEDKEKLTPLDWSHAPEMNGQNQCIVDFSLLFQPNTFATNIDLMDCNDDDFSLSSREATSMCKNFDFESISEDPSSFWKSGASVSLELDRSSSLNEISLEP